MLSKEQIEELAADDGLFCDLINNLTQIKFIRTSLGNAAGTMRLHGFSPATMSVIGEALEACSKKMKALDVALETLYGLTWHNWEDACKAVESM
jgi:hypothetical protein